MGSVFRQLNNKAKNEKLTLSKRLIEMTTKIYDLAVKTGEYTTGQGETKARYENIGAIMEKDDGGRFLMLKRTFNPAGVTCREGSDSILVSMFEPKEQDGRGQQQQQHRQQSGNSRTQSKPAFVPDDDDLPF